jgi:RecJ-like exonuclease
MNQPVEDGDETYESCPECRGSGRFGTRECPHCGGSGQVPAKAAKTQREEELSAAAEYGQQLAARSRVEVTVPTGNAVMVALVSDIYKLLIEKGIISQGDAIARLDKLSKELMSATSGDVGLAVALVDIVRNGIANELGRKPS